MDIGKMLFEENVGGLDLAFRAFVGTLAVIILASGIFSFWPIKLVLAIAAFAGLYTSITRHCTPYAFLGFSTSKSLKK